MVMLLKVRLWRNHDKLRDIYAVSHMTMLQGASVKPQTTATFTSA